MSRFLGQIAYLKYRIARSSIPKMASVTRLESGVVIIKPPNANNKLALFSYIVGCFDDLEQDRYAGHSNQWEAREIAIILLYLGYEVHAMDFSNTSNPPSDHYDLIFDIFKNIARFKWLCTPASVKLMHMTGSSPHWQNASELLRAKEFLLKKGVVYKPKLQIDDFADNIKSMEIADACSLIGNHVTLSTYPAEIASKTRLVPVTRSDVGAGGVGKIKSDRSNQFIWLGSAGLLLKGLDLVLDVFERRRDLIINVIGAVEEPDFIEAYRTSMDQPNIRINGFIPTNDLRFAQIVSRSCAFIAPSCSEGMSSSVITCLQMGLYPIISRRAGVDLPDNCGICLESLNAAALETAIDAMIALSDREFYRQTRHCTRSAIRSNSQEVFSKTMFSHIVDTINRKGVRSFSAGL